ncbi:DNA-directed DNA polymerase, partial [Tanacetum coccineum]
MLAIFHDMIEESVEVFMDDFLVFGNSFDKCLNNLDKMLQRCKDAHLVLNWEKCHFMVREGIVLGHKVSSAGLEVNKAKINVISKLSPPTNIKCIRSFLRHAGFYRRFIKDFSKIARPLTKLLEKDTQFEFNDECESAFELLKEKLTCAPVIVRPNWNLPFELMCDASDFTVGAVLEFDIEIKDRKGTENVAADYLSRIENDETSNDSKVGDNFPEETLMKIDTRNEPWFADFANYLAREIIPKRMTYQQKKKFFSDLKYYFWKEPYLFKICSDEMIRRCISGLETQTILDQCHHGPVGGHYEPNITAKKVLDSGFYGPTIIKEAHTLVRLCEECQKTENISKHDEMPLNNIQSYMEKMEKHLLSMVIDLSYTMKKKNIMTQGKQSLPSFPKNELRRAEPPKSKKQRKADSFKSSEETPIRKSTRVKRSAKVSSAGSKKKATAKADTGKGLKVLSEVALSEEAQLKEVLKQRTSTKPRVLDVPKQDSESEMKSWGDSNEDDDDEEEASNNDDDDNNDDDSNGDADDGNDDGNGDVDDGNDDGDDDDENVDDEEQQEEEKEENADERVPTTEEKNEEEEGDYEMLYKDVNVNLQQEDVDMTNADQGGAQDSDLQYEDAHVTLTASQKTAGQTQSSFVYSNFTSKLLNLENVSPAEYTMASVMDTTAQQTSSTMIITTPLPPPLSYKVEFEKEDRTEQERFIEIIDKSVKEMVKDEVKGQLNKILPKKIADFATPMIERNVVDSYERVVLAKSASQPKSTYEAAASLTEFELKKILLD